MAFLIYGISNVVNVTTNFTTGQWYYMVCEMRSDVDIINNKMWINGAPQTLQQDYPDDPTYRNFNGGVGKINSFKALDVFYNYMGNNKYSVFKVYNRVLTQAEITNNYNYYKPIYNLV